MNLHIIESHPDAPADRPTLTREHGRAGMAAVFQIAENWGFKNDEIQTLLGSPSRATFFKWKAGDVRALSSDTMTRLSLILGIHKALRILYADHAIGDDWVNRPNAAFGGATAKDRMCAGEIMDMAYVRDYLDGIRGGWS